ncbi:MAG: GAF domain-containing protein [Chloroflexi bacterium CFX2]|nr:GAF domain-containing protein [Chloroflexi bacterium CFX2]
MFKFRMQNAGKAMNNFLREVFAPPFFEDGEKTRIAALLNSILWAMIMICALYSIFALISLGQPFSALLTMALVIAGFFLRALLARGWIKLTSISLLTIINLILILSIAISGGITGASYFSLDSLPSPVIPQNLITYFSSLVMYLFFIAILLQASANGVSKLLERLNMTTAELTAKNQEIQIIADTLESTVAARTSELDAANLRNDRRARQFEAITKISRVITQTQNLDTLLTQVTELISGQFGYYHTGVFLLDSNNEFAVLIAANSAGGKRMLQRNHKLKIGQTGIVGYVAGAGLPRIALDTGADAIYFNNPDLPETRSEMALPLIRKGNEIIGVLDVQSREPNAFSQEDVRILSTLADQVAVAIENSRLFEVQERILNEAQAIYSRDLRESWLRFTKSKNIVGVQRRNLKTKTLPEPVDLPGADDALSSGRVVQKTEADGASSLTIPIKLRDQTVGVVYVKVGKERVWSDDELDIINAIVERAALSIENARLLEESRRTAEREHIIGEISTKISAGTQIDEILKTAVRELGSHIIGAQVTVEIGGGG